MRILSACEATPTRQKSCDLSPPLFFLTQSCSWGVFVLLPGVEDRSELTSAVIHVPLGKLVPCPLIEQLTPVTPLNLQSINCLVL